MLEWLLGRELRPVPRSRFRAAARAFAVEAEALLKMALAVIAVPFGSVVDEHLGAGGDRARRAYGRRLCVRIPHEHRVRLAGMVEAANLAEDEAVECTIGRAQGE